MKIKTLYPCCKGVAIINAIQDVPIERYDKQCPKCKTQWVVTRKRMKETKGMKVDNVEWECVKTGNK